MEMQLLMIFNELSEELQLFFSLKVMMFLTVAIIPHQFAHKCILAAPNQSCCTKTPTALSHSCRSWLRRSTFTAALAPRLQVSLLPGQRAASVQGLGHVPHSHLRAVLLRLRPTAQPHEEGRAELCQHLRVLQQGRGVASPRPLPPRRQTLCALHRALPLLQEVSSSCRALGCPGRQ